MSVKFRNEEAFDDDEVPGTFDVLVSSVSFRGRIKVSSNSMMESQEGSWLQSFGLKGGFLIEPKGGVLLLLSSVIS